LSSPAVTLKDPYEVPSAPEDIELHHRTRDAITLVWTKPEFDGNKDIKGYIVQYRQTGNVAWIKYSDDPIIDKIATVGGLDEGTEYEFRIAAVNEMGQSRFKVLPDYVSTKKAVGEVPYIVEDFQEITGDEHTTAELACKITGRPLPDIKWYRYGKEIVSGRKHKMRSDGETHILSVADLSPQDEGHYTIIATNNVGACEVEANLLVNCTPQFDPTRMFRDTIMVNQGNNLRIQVPYCSRPKPKAKWTYDSRPVETKGKGDESKEIETTDKYTYLLIRDAVRKDSGVYKCTIENKMGKLNVKINVNVMNVPSMVQNVELVETTASTCTIKFEPPKDNGVR
jgi:titin